MAFNNRIVAGAYRAHLPGTRRSGLPERTETGIGSTEERLDATMILRPMYFRCEIDREDRGIPGQAWGRKSRFINMWAFGRNGAQLR